MEYITLKDTKEKGHFVDIARSRRYICAMKLFAGILSGALLLAATPVAGQVPLPVTPNWTSVDSDYSTGAALVDLDRDEWLDLVVANGNDMARQHVVVYYNRKDGTFPTVADWRSNDVDYHGHIAVADINGDGYPDIAVSVYIGAAGFDERGYVKVYMNHNGVLESTPSWRSADSLYTFSCAFGDLNGDGRPDLAVACGESYGYHAEQDRVYLNQGGRLDSLPSWKSVQSAYSYDLGWADFDNDGLLDLVFANERGPNVIYRNYGDSLGTVPFWRSTDQSQYANSLAIGDVNNDGHPDLAVSDNNQLGGSGHFKVYINSGGMLSNAPIWSAAFSGMESGIALIDITNDGWRDLIGGGWWEACRVFTNAHGKFGQQPSWTSSTSSVVEAIVAGDIDNAGLDTLRIAYAGDGARKLFMIPKAPLQNLLSASVGSQVLSYGSYCCDFENGWVSLAIPPPPGDSLVLLPVVSHSLDLAVSNWDPTVGNYIFMNKSGVTGVTAGGEHLPNDFRLLQNYPNPFNPRTVVSSQLPVASHVSLVVYDILGREVAVLVNERRAAGSYRDVFDGSGLASGVYLCRLSAGGFIQMMKMVLAK
jgi:hypothetical protein